MEDIMIKFYEKKQKIIEELVLEEIKLQRESIIKNIAERDQRRVDKQAAKDRGVCGIVISKEELDTLVEITEQIVEPVIEILEATSAELWVDTTDGTNSIVHKAVDLGPFDPKLDNSEAYEKPLVPTPATEIEEAIKVSDDLGDVLEEVDENIALLKKIGAEHPRAIEAYREDSGRNAVWRGNITKGFQQYCKEVLGITIEVD